jgi:hypothetical protein
VSTPPTPSPPPTYFVPGTPVALQNLTNQPKFNGLCGVVSAFDAGCDRYDVLINVDNAVGKRLVKVKAHNLVAQRTPPFDVAQPHRGPNVTQCVGVTHSSR